MVLPRLPRQLWFSLNCCVTPQSDIARVRVDRSLIGGPTNFRHIGHLGAGDLSDAPEDPNLLSTLLNSKGDGQVTMHVPNDSRAKDQPIQMQAIKV